MEKRRLGPCITFFPQPATLISSVDADGRADLMAASWVALVSKTPPTVAVSLHHGRLTYRNIVETGCFAVNVMPASLAAETDYCGLRSGREEDKPATAGLALAPADHIAAPLVAQSPLNLECRLSGEMEIGEYRLLLGEILEVHAVEGAFRAAGEIDPKVFDPLVYLGGIRQYWSLGEKIENAYKAGTKFFGDK